MEWYYAIEGQRQGPVSMEAMARLVAAGTVTASTLVWRAGMAGWQPWRDVAPTQPLPPVLPELPTAAPHPVAPGAEPEPALRPAAVMAPGTRATLDAEAFWQRLKAHGYDTSAGGCLSRAWALYTAAFFPCLGITLLAYLIMMVAANVPLVGLAAQFLIVPQLTAGVYWYFLRRVRGQPAELNDLFVGFQRGFGQLALVNLIQFAIMLPVIIVMAVFGFGLAAAGTAVGEGEMPTAATLGFVVVMAAIVVALALVLFRLIFAHVLIVDRGDSAMEALKLSWRIVGLRYLTLLGLALLLMLIGLGGLLALIIGAILVLPLFPAAFAIAYEDAVQSAHAEPSMSP